MPARRRTGIRAFRHAGAIGRPLCLPDELVGEEDEAATNGVGVNEVHGLFAAGLIEEALAGPEHDREDDQPQLVDQVMLDQRAPELVARGDDDLSVQLLLQPRDLLHHIAAEDRRVVSEELVAGAAEEPCLGAHRVSERELVPFFEAANARREPARHATVNSPRASPTRSSAVTSTGWSRCAARRCVSCRPGPTPSLPSAATPPPRKPASPAPPACSC